MNQQVSIVLFVCTMFFSFNGYAARAVEAPKTRGTVMALGKPVAKAQISLVSRFPQHCQTLTAATDVKGRFSIGPLCEYRTKIPSIIYNEVVTFGYQLLIAVDGRVYQWQVAKEGYSPFKQQVTINLTTKQLCDVNTKQCFTLVEQPITSTIINDSAP